MGVFEGKSPTERNKIIAAIVLGVLAIISLAYTFGGSLIGGSTKVSVTATATPTASPSPNAPQNSQIQVTAPVEDEIYSAYTVTPISYIPGQDVGGIGGRNIFAFYEPGTPLPPPPVTPKPSEPPPTFSPPPPPTPHPIQIFAVSPQSKYAGEKGFLIQVSGQDFTADSKIVFNGTPLQTTFVSENQLTANVPEAFIRSAGFGQIIVDTFDGKNFSNAFQFNIQAPPKPTVEYIGMIARRHYNNDTAYFEKRGVEEPIGKRLNDVVDGRFRLISISEKEVELEDTRLGFRHKLEMKRPDPSQSTSAPITRSPNRRRVNRRTTTPRVTNTPTTVTDCVPGIPCNLKRSQPTRRPNTPNPNSNVKIPTP